MVGFLPGWRTVVEAEVGREDIHGEPDSLKGDLQTLQRMDRLARQIVKTPGRP